VNTSEHNRFLRHCDEVYRTLLTRVSHFSRRETEARLAWLQFTAEFASVAHPGRYADGALENLVLEVGLNLEEFASRSTSKQAFNIQDACLPALARRKILHVATTVYHVGGHTRLIKNWIKNDPSSCHSLAILDQQTEELPNWLREAVEESGGKMVIFPPRRGLLTKAVWLRRLVQSNVDTVVLHQHPRDVVPVVALATKDCPPVALLNHADHVFWLGGSVADTIINIRESGASISRARRFARSDSLLPVPLENVADNSTKRDVRAQLGIPEDQIVLLSIGTKYKYRPTDTHNFFRTARMILEQNQDAHLYLIGISENDLSEEFAQVTHPRLHPLGVIEFPFRYQVAADIYLEGFPFGSLMSLLEVAMRGICPVLALAPASKVLATDDLALDGLIVNAPDQAKYVEVVNFLIRNKDERERIGQEIKQRVVDFHCGNLWQEHLTEIYNYLSGVAHESRALPNTTYSETPDDISLSEFDFHGLESQPSLAFTAQRNFYAEGRVEDLIQLLKMSLAANETMLSYKNLLYLLVRYAKVLSLSDMLQLATASFPLPLFKTMPPHIRGWGGVFYRYEETVLDSR
jgi:glycosyltransferase involved in cell wall biosynthesis